VGASRLWWKRFTNKVQFTNSEVRIEAVQRRFTKRLSSFSKLSYEERLASLNCESLYSRHVKCDLVMCCQMLTSSVDIDANAFFTRSYLSTTRGNSMKLFKPQITSVWNGNFFANRVISHWN